MFRVFYSFPPYFNGFISRNVYNGLISRDFFNGYVLAFQQYVLALGGLAAGVVLRKVLAGTVVSYPP